MDTFLNYTSILSLGTEWFKFIVDVTVKATIVLILAFIVNLVWRRASAAARNLVWNLAVASLLIVPLFSLILPEWEVSLFSYNQAAEQPLQADNVSSSLYNEQQTENLTNNEEFAGNLSTITEPLSDNSKNSSVIARAGLFIKNTLSNLHWSVWLLLLWLLGALFVFARLLTGYTVMRRITKHFIPVKNRTLNYIAADCAGETGIKRTIQLLQCRHIAVPMTRGWLKPKIILPEEALSWSEKRRKSVLLHELAHVKRLDYLSSFGVHAVSVMYWFNPLVWIAVRKLYVECEQACDDLVLEAGTKASDYANHLVEVARSLVSSKWAPSLEVAMARKSTLEGRLLAIFNENKPRNHMKLSTALIIGFLGISFVMLLACVQPEPQNIQVLADILTLELSFGDEKTITKDEYLLVEPKSMTVDEEGNIYVADEERIKVFDNSGREKAIIGSPGQGPGEFYGIGPLTISPDGLLTANNGFVPNVKFNLYGPDYKFIKIIHRNPLKSGPSAFSGNFPKVFTINENEYIAHSVLPSDKKEGNFVFYKQTLSYFRNNDETVFGEYTNISSIITKGAVSTVPGQGALFCDMLPGNRVVYTHTGNDVHTEGNKQFYTLHIYDIHTNKKIDIQREYIPVEFSESDLNRMKPEERAKRRQSRVIRESDKISWDIIKSSPFYKPIQELLVDGSTIFAFTNYKNDMDEYMVDIFDAEKGVFVKSLYFPIFPNRSYYPFPDIIKNGYAYMLNRPVDDFLTVEKYKINPAVYGK